MLYTTSLEICGLKERYSSKQSRRLRMSASVWGRLSALMPFTDALRTMACMYLP